MSGPARFPAALYDGVRATPTRGVAVVDGADLEFIADGGAHVAWPLARLHETRLVAGELRVTLLRSPLDEYRGVSEVEGQDAPLHELVVHDGRAFEDVLSAASVRYGSNTRIAARRGLRRMGVGAWFVIALVVVPLAYWFYSVLVPRAHVFISKETEARLGDSVVEALASDWQEVHDERLVALLQQMAEELAEPDNGYDVRITIVDRDVPNAFAAPGGHIVVFRGLVRRCETADALAGVLAHELAHVEERHGLRHLLRSFGLLYFAGALVGGGLEGFESAETVVELSSGLLVLKHSRQHEREADRIAVAKLQRAGRSAAGLAAFFEEMQREVGTGVPAWLSTHPLGAERIATLTALAAEVPAGRPWLPQAEWEDLQARVALPGIGPK